MSSLWRRMRRLVRDGRSSSEMGQSSDLAHLSPQMMKELLAMVAETEPNDCSCSDCDRMLAGFVEAAAAGEPASELMPRVQKHLDSCPDCYEEFEALLLVLRQEIASGGGRE